MQKLIIIISTLVISHAHAQLSYVDIDWTIDQTVIMQNGQTDIMEFDIDEDGTNDLRITSWSNHTAGIETAIECLLLDNSLHEGFEVDNCYSFIDCFGGFGTSSITAYLHSSDCQNPANEYLKFPFEFTAGNGQLRCGFLYVRYQGNTIIIEGYAWNPSSNNCSCSSSGWLSVDEPHNTESTVAFEYYTLLGQKVDSPHGLVLKVYENGTTDKVFFP